MAGAKTVKWKNGKTRSGPNMVKWGNGNCFRGAGKVETEEWYTVVTLIFPKNGKMVNGPVALKW